MSSHSHILRAGSRRAAPCAPTYNLYTLSTDSLQRWTSNSLPASSALEHVPTRPRRGLHVVPPTLTLHRLQLTVSHHPRPGATPFGPEWYDTSQGPTRTNLDLPYVARAAGLAGRPQPESLVTPARPTPLAADRALTAFPTPAAHASRSCHACNSRRASLTLAHTAHPGSTWQAYPPHAHRSHNSRSPNALGGLQSASRGMPGRGWCAVAPRRRQARPLIPRRRLPPRLGNTLVCDPPAGGPGGARRALAIPPCPRAAGRRSPAGVHHLCPIWLSLTRPPGKQAAVYTLAVPDRPEADAAETRTNRVHWHDRGAQVWEHCSPARHRRTAVHSRDSWGGVVRTSAPHPVT